ncbi:MAG: hypothetical protein K9L02_05415 [Acholeplasmataceae bacterium]|nr:hypothetical protein [Acholeplasmataceae bacterium]
MRRLGIIIVLVILTFSIIISSTYAWLTYVQKKGFVGVETHEISLVLDVNSSEVTESLVIDDLAFIDYQNDFVANTSGMLNQMASSWLIKLTASNTSPLAKHQVTLDLNHNGLIYLLIYEGMNGELSSYISEYNLLVDLIISGYATKEEQLNAIDVHNQLVLDEIYSQEFRPLDYVEFQIVIWGDYDALDPEISYLDVSFEFSLSIQSVNSKGEVVS